MTSSPTHTLSSLSKKSVVELPVNEIEQTLSMAKMLLVNKLGDLLEEADI